MTTVSPDNQLECYMSGIESIRAAAEASLATQPCVEQQFQDRLLSGAVSPDKDERRSPIGKHAKLNELIMLAMLSACSEQGSGYEQAILKKHADHAAKLWAEHLAASPDKDEVELLQLQLAAREAEVEALMERLAAMSPVDRLREALEEAFDFLGGVDGAAEIRDRILAALSSPEPVGEVGE